MISACLAGENCKYNGGNNFDEKLMGLLNGHDVIAVCPEVLGGLPVPRAPGEICSGVVKNPNGTSVDAQYRHGAEKALEIARNEKVSFAILQPRSPSCGVGRVYDGTFSRNLVDGNGVFASKLIENGITAVNADRIEEIEKLLNSKVVFLDIDGTIVDYANVFPESAKEAIRIAHDNGHRIYLCTGRSKAERCEEIIEACNADGIICANGSYVESDGKVLCHKTIPSETTWAVIDYLHEHGMEFYEESNEQSYASENFLAQAGEKFASYMGREYTSQTDPKELIGTFFPKMVYDSNVYRDDIYKISYVMNSWDDFYAIKEAFPMLQHGSWGGTNKVPSFGDVVVAGVSKATGVEIILNSLGRDSSDAVAFGDSDPDLPMLRYCGFSVAMGNASKNVKETADYITGDVNSDGLYKAFSFLKLI